MEHGSFKRWELWSQRAYYNEYIDCRRIVGGEAPNWTRIYRKEYLLKPKQQETAMRALRHQINPHFLYNTLESIRAKRWYSKDRRRRGGHRGSWGALPDSGSGLSEVISLRKEVEVLEMYLKLMSSVRGYLVYRVDIGREEAKDVIPSPSGFSLLAGKFLQPLHGPGRANLIC